MKKHLKIKFSSFDTFCLILKIKKITPSFARPITGKRLQQRQLRRTIFEKKLTAEYLFQVVISTLWRFLLITLIFQQYLNNKNKFDAVVHPASIYFFKVNNRNTRKKMLNMFKVNNKKTYFIPFTTVSTLGFA